MLRLFAHTILFKFILSISSPGMESTSTCYKGLLGMGNVIGMCGSINEDAQHYFFHCRMFNRQRTILLTEVRKITQPTLVLLLHGDANVSLEEHICGVLHVHNYLKDTHRFQRDVH